MNIKKSISIFLSIVLSLCFMTISASAAWKVKDGKKCYIDENGKSVTGWRTIDNNKYYFASDGSMKTGWLTMKSGKKYYLGDDGVMVTGWNIIDGFKYYFGSDGKMRTGKVTINGKEYEFEKSGALKNKYVSKLMAPYKGFKFGMTKEQVIKKGKFKNYMVTHPLILMTTKQRIFSLMR